MIDAEARQAEHGLLSEAREPSRRQDPTVWETFAKHPVARGYGRDKHGNGTARQLQRRSLDHSRSHSFVGAQGGGKSAQDCFLMSFSFSSSMPSPGFVGTLMNPPL